MSWSRENGIISIRITQDQYNFLLLTLGAACGTQPRMRQSILRLANEINDGNPDWTHYAIEDADK